MANPTALVTGASRGIGQGISIELARAGFNVVVNYAGSEDGARRTAEECAEAAGENDIQTHIVRCDVGKAADRERMIGAAREQFGSLELLVNNAGITSIGRRDVLEAREEEFDALMAINLKGPYFLTQLAANWMRERDTSAEQSSPRFAPKVVTVSSISAYAVSTNRGDYCMAKAALGMMTKVYAARLAEFGINVFEVCPGVIASDMTAPVKEKYDKMFADGFTPIRRWGQPEDVGRAIVAIAEGYFPYSTGDTINVDGGFQIRQL
ncbi:MAG: 3-ketoacyl-ACP reductase [Verrucomicrobiales bacterium]|nr:3-ketoacyl-ACP reductase [Verrucomicrobiales bacterium]|tara:strand:- start:2841 stop:3638 length:798 start_codon:yes stop_codon:yes gene_type:complete